MQKDIKQTWSLPHSKETVWEFLTNSDLLAQWLMTNDFKPIVGHQFMFHTAPKIKFGFDGKIYCEVLELIPNQKLSYTWKGGPGNGKIKLDSIVTWTLTETASGTDLHLEHTGFKGIQNYLPYLTMNMGWSGRIKNRLLERLTK